MAVEKFDPILRLAALGSALQVSRNAWLRSSGLGLENNQLNILGCLARGKMTMPKLLTVTGLSRNKLHRGLARMEELGLIAREQDSLDRRSMNVELTKKGEIFYGKVQEAMGAWADNIFSQLPPEDASRFWDTCKMLSNLAKRGTFASFLGKHGQGQPAERE